MPVLSYDQDLTAQQQSMRFFIPDTGEYEELTYRSSTGEDMALSVMNTDIVQNNSVTFDEMTGDLSMSLDTFEHWKPVFEKFGKLNELKVQLADIGVDVQSILDSVKTDTVSPEEVPDMCLQALYEQSLPQLAKHFSDRDFADHTELYTLNHKDFVDCEYRTGFPEGLPQRLIITYSFDYSEVDSAQRDVDYGDFTAPEHALPYNWEHAAVFSLKDDNGLTVAEGSHIDIWGDFAKEAKSEHAFLTQKLYAAVWSGNAAKVEEFFRGEGKNYSFPRNGGPNDWDFSSPSDFRDAISVFLFLPDERQNTDVFLSLVRHGAELNSRHMENSLLIYSFVKDHPEVIPELFKAGATLFPDVGDQEHLLTTVTHSSKDAYFNEIMEYGDWQNAPANMELLELYNEEMPFNAALQVDDPDKFARLANALGCIEEAREAVTSYLSMQPERLARYTKALDEQKNAFTILVNGEYPKYRVLKFTPPDTQAKDFFTAHLDAHPLVTKIACGITGREVYNMPESSFANFSQWFDKVNLTNRYIKAVEAEYGANSPEFNAFKLRLNSEERSLDASHLDQFQSTLYRRLCMARSEVLSALSHEKMRENGFLNNEVSEFIYELGVIAKMPRTQQREAVNGAISMLDTNARIEVLRDENLNSIRTLHGSFLASLTGSLLSAKITQEQMQLTLDDISRQRESLGLMNKPLARLESQTASR